MPFEDNNGPIIYPRDESVTQWTNLYPVDRMVKLTLKAHQTLPEDYNELRK